MRGNDGVSTVACVEMVES